MSEKKEDKKKKKQSVLEKEIFSIMEKSMKTALDAAVDDLLKHWDKEIKIKLYRNAASRFRERTSQPWESLIGSPFFVSCRYRRISVRLCSVADSPNNRHWKSKSLFVVGLPTPKTQAPLIEQIARNTPPTP